MVALRSADGGSIALISVDPKEPGAPGGGLPTAIPSPSLLSLTEGTALPGEINQLVFDHARNALWSVGGQAGSPIDLLRFDVAAGTLTHRSIPGTIYDGAKARLALAPDGSIWIGGSYSVFVYDPATDAVRSLELPGGSDVQVDPASGNSDPWVAGVAFDESGTAYVARNWVRSLAVVDPSRQVLDRRLDVSDGFPMTGDIAIAGGRVYVVADPQSGLAFGVGLRDGTSNTKFTASRIAAVGDRLLVGGEPPTWIDANGTAAMTEPVLPRADLVAGLPDGTCVLYSSALGEAQWRDGDGHVSGQAAFQGTPPIVRAIALDGQGRLWAVTGSDVGGGLSLLPVRVARP